MFAIAIIGFGPRGLVALERARAYLREQPFASRIDIYDPAPSFGWGVHSPQLPSYLRLNTVAAQLTGYADPAMVAPGAPVTEGPTFYQWVLDNQIPLVEYGHSRSPRGDDFLPRCAIGSYLQQVATELIEDTENLTITVRREAVEAIRPTDRDVAVVTKSAPSGTVYDLAITATGHGVRPSKDNLEGIIAGQRVLLRGMGLTAMDMVAELTLGRGGQFTRSSTGTLTYVSSGNEPTIVLSSRSGQLPAARPVIDLTTAPHSSDLFRDAELLLAQHLSGTGDSHTAGQALLLAELGHELAPDELERVERKTNGPTRWSTYEGFTATIIDDAEWDLAHSHQGLPGSSYKRALEALRTNREHLRRAVENSDERTRDRFFAATPDLINRLVIGPQKERIEELLALYRSGIVEVGPGPDPEVINTPRGLRLRSRWIDTPAEIPIDRIVEARVTASAETVLAGTGGHLHGARLHTTDGPSRVCIVGPPAEGQTYYNHYIPSPGVASRAHRELDIVLEEILRQVRGLRVEAVAP